MSLALLFFRGGSPVAVAEPARALQTLESLGLHIEVRKPDGTSYRWDGDGHAEDMPTGIQFSTKRMEGFERESVTLPRRGDRDYPDLELHDDLFVLSDSGQIVWEGRVSGLTRKVDEDHSVEVEAVGWMAHTRDRKFRNIYVDRDFSAWGQAGVAYRLANITSGFSPQDASVGSDPTSLEAALMEEFTGAWVATGKPLVQAWYDAGPDINIGKVYFAWKKASTVVNADTDWQWDVNLSSDDIATSTNTSGNLRAAGPGTGTLTASGADKRFAVVRHLYNDNAGADGVKYGIYWTTLAVYGDHDLETHGSSTAVEAEGVYASDAMGHIVATYCPKLVWAGNDTTYPIPQLAFKELTDPYDALLVCNAPHLLDLAVWENRELHYYPVDLTDWDWEVRLDDYGVALDGGESVEDFVNGMVVEYEEVTTGKPNILYPTDHAELRDDSELNAANRHGLEQWDTVKLSVPATEDIALQIGRAYLAERNQVKAPGTITVKGGYVRDRQGNRQPAWKVRATDTVVVADHPYQAPRLITETQWAHDSKTLTIATDSAIRRVEAFIDRLSTRVAARNLAA